MYGMSVRPLDMFFQCGNRLYTSESDVYRRQILTHKDSPRTERVKVLSTGSFNATLTGVKHRELSLTQL